MRPAALVSLFLLPLAIVALAPLGCSGESGGATTGDPMEAGDGKFHPPGNGTAMNEGDACKALTDTQAQRLQFLGCAGTTRTCPEFLRVEFGTQCLQYDQGSVQGCIDYYTGQKSCPELIKALSNCSVTPLAGTSPKGCP
jgi:hypothetical protein